MRINFWQYRLRKKHVDQFRTQTADYLAQSTQMHCTNKRVYGAKLWAKINTSSLCIGEKSPIVY